MGSGVFSHEYEKLFSYQDGFWSIYHVCNVIYGKKAGFKEYYNTPFSF